jgi:hypothetical protein
MGATQIREELYRYINKGDSRLLKILYTVAKEYTKEDYTLPGEPMSSNILRSRIRAAKARIKSGQYTTQEDLEREIELW